MSCCVGDPFAFRMTCSVERPCRWVCLYETFQLIWDAPVFLFVKLLEDRTPGVIPLPCSCFFLWLAWGFLLGAVVTGCLLWRKAIDLSLRGGG